MNRLKQACKTVCTAVCLSLIGQAHAADDLVIPGDNSKNLLDKVPLQISPEIEWNKAENDKRLREGIIHILSNAELFIEMPEVVASSVDQTAENKIETNPEGQNGEVP